MHSCTLAANVQREPVSPFADRRLIGVLFLGSSQYACCMDAVRTDLGAGLKIQVNMNIEYYTSGNDEPRFHAPITARAALSY